MNTTRDIITQLRAAGHVSAPEKLRQRIEMRIHLLPQPLAVGFMGAMALRFAVAVAALLALGTGMAVAHKSRPGDVLFPVKQFVQQVVHLEPAPTPTPTPSPLPTSVFMEPAHAARKEESRQAVLGDQKEASESGKQREFDDRREDETNRRERPRRIWNRYNRH